MKPDTRHSVMVFGSEILALIDYQIDQIGLIQGTIHRQKNYTERSFITKAQAQKLGDIASRLSLLADMAANFIAESTEEVPHDQHSTARLAVTTSEVGQNKEGTDSAEESVSAGAS